MTRPWRVLALDPTHRGFGFVVLEGPTTLVDWGVKRVGPAKNQETIAKVSGLIERYRPGQDPAGDADVLCGIQSLVIHGSSQRRDRFASGDARRRTACGYWPDSGVRVLPSPGVSLKTTSRFLEHATSTGR